MDLVLDASVALSWCFKNEATAAADRVLAVKRLEAAGGGARYGEHRKQADEPYGADIRPPH